MTLIKDAGKNSDGYEAKVKETASLQGRFFVVGQLDPNLLLRFLTITSSSYRPGIRSIPAAFSRFMSSSTFLSVTLA